MYFNPKNADETIVKRILKRRNIYCIVWVCLLLAGGFTGAIPVIGWYLSTALLILCGIAAGLAMFCINNIRYIRSGGTKKGGGLLWIVLFVFGFFVMPFLTVVVCAHTPLGGKVIGV